MLELTEALALAIGCIHSHITHVVDIIDGRIALQRASRRVDQNHTVSDLGQIELVDHALGNEDVGNILLSSPLRIGTRNHRKLLRLGRVLGEKPHEPLNSEVQPLAIRVAIAVQEYRGILGDIQLCTKCGPIGKRTEDFGIRCMLKNPNLCLGIPTKLTLVNLGPLRGKRLDRLTGLINAVHKWLGDPQIDLVEIGPDLVVGLGGILLQSLQKLLDNERVILENHKRWVDRINVLRELVKPKPLLARILGGRCVLGNHSIGNLAMIGAPRVALKPEMKDLDLRGQCGHLTEKIVRDLGLPRCLIHMRTHEENAH